MYEFEEVNVSDAELKADRTDQLLEVRLPCCPLKALGAYAVQPYSLTAVNDDEHRGTSLSLLYSVAAAQHSIARWCHRKGPCNDTAVHLMQGDEAKVDVGLGGALALFGLKAVEIFREPGQDMKVLVGWGGDTIVVAFRGTASFSNVLNDIQVPAEPVPACTL